MINDKRGDIFQLSVLLILVFVLAVVGLLFLTLSQGVTNFYDRTNLLNGTAIGQDAINTIKNTAPTTTDYAIFFIFLGGTLGLCISAVKTNFSPTILFLFLMLLVITIFISSGLVNIYSGFAETPTLATAASQLTLTNFILSRHTPLIFACIGALILLIMYGKSGSDIVT